MKSQEFPKNVEGFPSHADIDVVVPWQEVAITNRSKQSATSEPVLNSMTGQVSIDRDQCLEEHSVDRPHGAWRGSVDQCPSIGNVQLFWIEPGRAPA